MTEKGLKKNNNNIEQEVYNFIDQEVVAKAKYFFKPNNNAYFFKEQDDFYLPSQIVKYRVVEHDTVSAKRALKFHAYMFGKLGVVNTL